MGAKSNGNSGNSIEPIFTIKDINAFFAKIAQIPRRDEKD